MLGGLSKMIDMCAALAGRVRRRMISHPFTTAPIGGACYFGIWILAGWMSAAFSAILWGRTAQLANLRRRRRNGD
ncbi:hypothetical protein [Spongiactinospora sp. 9N601]|uniref:hypothetical protein n=1 Tax=Spongiactinospora sp. 9N601 TaxID=3375149 RepID=UPI0037C7C761